MFKRDTKQCTRRRSSVGVAFIFLRKPTFLESATVHQSWFDSRTSPQFVNPFPLFDLQSRYFRNKSLDHSQTYCTIVGVSTPGPKLYSKQFVSKTSTFRLRLTLPFSYVPFSWPIHHVFLRRRRWLRRQPRR